ncbi:MAG: hypothetical protein ABI340_08950 [Nitrososphaera sp.]|jgi:hypothetical protein
MFETDEEIASDIIKQTHIKKEIAQSIIQSLSRIDLIDESKTFSYENLKKFENRLPEIIKLKEKAILSFRPFAEKYKISLCASMGIPMMKSITDSKDAGTYEVFHQIFGLTNAKAKRFGLAALYCAIRGDKADTPTSNVPYNIVFDRDSPWTYRNEAEHMEEYARYHFNSYVINEAYKQTYNPFEPVISLYEKGIADFIFMQTEENQITDEKLCTFHMINIPSKGNVIGIHMNLDDHIKYFRKWGEPYFNLRSVQDTPVELKVTGIADQRFRPS